MTAERLKKLDMPGKPGVYFWKHGKEIIYIGKATSLRDRVRSYFASDLIHTRGQAIVDMVFKADMLEWQTTDSVLEALILEASLIKQYLPLYNTKEKDNKSFLCVVITKEVIPQVLIIRRKDIDTKTKIALFGRAKKALSIDTWYGPFTSGPMLREAMKIIRRIFPYRDDASSKRDNYEFYRQLGLTPNTKDLGSSGDYKVMIQNIKLFLSGKKKEVLRALKKEMQTHAKVQAFEKAGDVKKRVFALEHINDIALIKKDITTSYSSEARSFRVEAYDIAHMSGKSMVGVMTVVENGVPAKQEYRKFIIKSVSGANDPAALAEVLTRRLAHTTWTLPNIIVVDGNDVQKNVAEKILQERGFTIPVVALVKDERHKARAILGDTVLAKKHKDAILLANSEAHRFAIAFHKEKRSKQFLK